MMFVGYNNEHSGNCYRMYNPVTSRVVITQDVIWLGRIFCTRLAHKLDHKLLPVVLVPISMNAHEVQDKTEQRLEVITRIVPVSDERGGATMALSDKANAANAKWATYRKRSGHAVGRNGRRYNPATG
jgi:hypothetical protein